MKVSQKQKIKTKEKILKAAVEVISKKGFKTATMKSIAKKSGVADATLYNYFPTKEALLYGYYEFVFEKVTKELTEVKDFNTFTLKEQLQLFMENCLEVYLSDREFVVDTFQKTFFNITTAIYHISPIRKRFTQVIHELLSSAIEVEEIPDQTGLEIIERLMFDYYFGIVLYWIKDASTEFNQTTLLIDKTLDIIITILKSNITTKVADLMSYLFKTHVLSNFDTIKESAELFSKVKRNFMGMK